MKASLIITLLPILFRVGDAFTNPNNGGGVMRIQTKGPSLDPHVKRSRTSNKPLHMIIPADTIQDISSAIVAQHAGVLISSSQNHEAQFFGDLAHFFLDVVTIYSPDTILLRLLILFGRICSILSDYVPDHSMTYDEVAFQSTMVTISGHKLIQKLSTTMSSLKEATSFRDRRIYRNMFYPAGFTWIQYKSLLSLEVLQWNKYNPGEIFVQDSSSLLITYTGEIEQFNIGTNIKKYGTCDTKYCHDVIGNLSQGSEFLDRKRRKLNKERHDVEDRVNVLRSGSTGSILLRLDLKKLMQYSDEDDDISENMKNLYVNAMQKKLMSYSEGSNLRGCNETNEFAFLP